MRRQDARFGRARRRWRKRRGKGEVEVLKEGMRGGEDKFGRAAWSLLALAFASFCTHLASSYEVAKCTCRLLPQLL